MDTPYNHASKSKNIYDRLSSNALENLLKILKVKPDGTYDNNNMILLTPKNCKNIIGINPKEISYFELKKGSALFSSEENPKEAILIEITMKDGEKHNVFYSFDDKESREKCFSELKNLKIEEIINILNATQKL